MELCANLGGLLWLIKPPISQGSVKLFVSFVWRVESLPTKVRESSYFLAPCQLSVDDYVHDGLSKRCSRNFSV